MVHSSSSSCEFVQANWCAKKSGELVFFRMPRKSPTIKALSDPPRRLVTNNGLGTRPEHEDNENPRERASERDREEDFTQDKRSERAIPSCQGHSALLN